MGKIAKIRGAIKQLIADKEDTKQVFIILEALSGNSGLRAFKRFKKPRTRKTFSPQKSHWWNI